MIATPSASHFELAQQALRAGKHVVVDKPFTLTSDHAQQLIDLGRQQNKLVSAFQNRRWDGDFQTVCQILRQGLLGRLVEYESHFDRFRNYFSAERAWREQAGPGGGVLFDLGAHLIDQALVLFGSVSYTHLCGASPRLRASSWGSTPYFTNEPSVPCKAKRGPGSRTSKPDFRVTLRLS